MPMPARARQCRARDARRAASRAGVPAAARRRPRRVSCPSAGISGSSACSGARRSATMRAQTRAAGERRQVARASARAASAGCWPSRKSPISAPPLGVQLAGLTRRHAVEGGQRAVAHLLRVEVQQPRDGRVAHAASEQRRERGAWSTGSWSSSRHWRSAACRVLRVLTPAPRLSWPAMDVPDVAICSGWSSDSTPCTASRSSSTRPTRCERVLRIWRITTASRPAWSTAVCCVRSPSRCARWAPPSPCTRPARSRLECPTAPTSWRRSQGDTVHACARPRRRVGARGCGTSS